MKNYWEEDLAILSAENVEFLIEAAGLGSRLAALSLDTFIQLLIFALASLALVGFEYYFEISRSLSPFAVSTMTAIFYFLNFLLFFGYYFFFEWLWDGQTPGKRYFGLRVQQTNGLPLSFWPAAIRNIVRIVDFLPFAYGIGAAFAICNSLSQRAGDFAAGTLVVREGKREKAAVAPKIGDAVERFLKAATTVPGTEKPTKRVREAELEIESARVIDPEIVALARKISREDYEMARDFLARRQFLPAQARQRLAFSLAKRFATKLETVVPEHASEAFLEEHVVKMAKFYAV